MELERRAESCENIPFDVGSAGGSVRACATAAPNAADGETTLGRDDFMAPGLLVAGAARPAGKLFFPEAPLPCVPCVPGEAGLRSRGGGSARATALPTALVPGAWMGLGANPNLDWESLFASTIVRCNRLRRRCLMMTAIADATPIGISPVNAPCCKGEGARVRGFLKLEDALLDGREFFGVGSRLVWRQCTLSRSSGSSITLLSTIWLISRLPVADSLSSLWSKMSIHERTWRTRWPLSK